MLGAQHALYAREARVIDLEEVRVVEIDHGRSMARSTLSGMLVGPGLAKKWRPRGFETAVLMCWTS